MSVGHGTNFSEYFQNLRSEIERALESYTQFSSDCPEILAEAIRYSLLAPGKRLRPILTLMAAEACGCERQAAYPAACAVEMIHTYSLIHDDLPAMDDDDMRRGRPTCHVRFGEANAILAGDALLALAFETLSKYTTDSIKAARCCCELARAAGPEALVGGQVDDLEAESRSQGNHQAENYNLEKLEAIHRRKTGAMFLVSLRLGAIVAGGSELHLNSLSDFGRNLGLAFQIVDDLLDLKGNEASLGKRTRKDAAHGKLTYPGYLGVEQSSRRAEKLIQQACESLQSFGVKGDRLQALARFVVERNK